MSHPYAHLVATLRDGGVTLAEAERLAAQIVARFGGATTTSSNPEE